MPPLRSKAWDAAGVQQNSLRNDFDSAEEIDEAFSQLRFRGFRPVAPFQGMVALAPTSVFPVSIHQSATRETPRMATPLI